MDSTWQGTVLLADLRRDASRLYASAGPTKALQAIQNCVAVLERAAWDGGATFVRATGDEVMALFPAPTAAADAASAMQMAADALPPIGNASSACASPSSPGQSWCATATSSATP